MLDVGEGERGEVGGFTVYCITGNTEYYFGGTLLGRTACMCT